MAEGISPNPLNKISQVYLDRIAKINSDPEIAQKEREKWQTEAKVDTGSAEEKATARNKRNTPAGKDYDFDTKVFITRKPGESLESARTRKRRDAHAAKRGVSEAKVDTGDDVKKETDRNKRRFGKDAAPRGSGGVEYAQTLVRRREHRAKRGVKENFSDWRTDLREIVDEIESEAEKKVDEKKNIKNKVVINPKLGEAVEQMGGQLLEVAEVEDDDAKKDLTAADKDAQKAEALKKKEQMLKKRIVRMKMMAVNSGAADNIVAGYEPDIEGAVEYFYEEGINEEGIDLLIEEIGLEEFVDFVDGGAVELNEERKARKMNVRTLKATKKKAEEIKADKSDVVKKSTPLDTVRRARTERAFKKPKLAKPTPKSKKDYDGDGKKETPKQEHRGVRNKKITKAVKKVKPAQPKKPASKEGIRAKIKSVYDAGVKRHRKATQPIRVFHKGMKKAPGEVATFVKKAKRAIAPRKKVQEEVGISSSEKMAAARKEAKLKAKEAAAVKKAKTDKQKAAARKKSVNVRKQLSSTELAKYDTDGDGKVRVVNASYSWRDDLIEKDLNAAERRALPDKDFALPGKGKGPEGKQAGSYPIPDKSHARMALAMVAKHGTSEKKAKVRAAVAKKFPGIQQEDYETQKKGEVLKALDKKKFVKKYGKEKAPDIMYAVAAKTAKKKGDTSKSDDRYAYESLQQEAIERQAKDRKKLSQPHSVSGSRRDHSHEVDSALTDYVPRKGKGRMRPASKKEMRVSAMREDKAFDNVVGKLRKKYGKGAVLTKDSPAPKVNKNTQQKQQRRRAAADEKERRFKKRNPAVTSNRYPKIDQEAWDKAREREKREGIS